MSTPDPELQRLFEAHFDGRLSEEDRAALESRLRSDAAVRRAYWKAAHWHAAMSAWGSQHAGQQAAKEDLRTQSAGASSRRRIVAFPRWARFAVGIAASFVLVAILAWRSGRLPGIGPATVAELTYEDDAVWSRQPPRRDRAMTVGEYRLERGRVRFETTAGAVVTVAGPARFRFANADRIALASGRLTARMLRDDSRLTVNVDDMEVRDLGTAFGIDVGAGGHTLVSVFDGQVGVKNRQVSQAELKLSEGQSLVGRQGATPRMERADYSPEAFTDLWPLTVGIDEASRLIEFLPPGPLLRPLREYRSNDRLFLFPEQQQAVTPRALSIDLSADVPKWPDSEVSPYPLAGGQRVSSYLMFFQPLSSDSSGFRRLRGEITFQQRVVGLICSDQGLDASDGMLGIAAADYRTPGQRRGLEDADKENYRGSGLPHDSIRVSADGRTVQFDFYVSDEREQMRILVAAD